MDIQASEGTSLDDQDKVIGNVDIQMDIQTFEENVEGMISSKKNMKKKRKAGDGNILGSDDIKEIENETSATSFSQSGDESDDPPLSPIAGYNFTSDDENETSTNNRFSNILKRRRLNQEGDDGDIKVSDEGPPSTIVPPFQGFKTASGKEVKVSDEALKRVLAFNKQVESTMTITPLKQVIPPLKSSSPTPFQGFKTASGKEVKVSDEAIKRARAFNEDVEGTMTRDVGDDGDIKESNQGPSSTIVPQFQGFKTASGKEVKVSDAALKKAWAFDREESLSKLTITPIKKFIPPLKRPSFPTPTSTVTSLSGGSRKFKPPTRIAPVPSSKIFSSMVRAPATVQSPPTPPLSIIGNVEAGMTQEVLDCISALIADGDEF